MKANGLLVCAVSHRTEDLMKLIHGQDAGYTYVNVDDCYAEKERSPNGDIVESV